MALFFCCFVKMSFFQHNLQKNRFGIVFLRVYIKLLNLEKIYN